MIIDALFSLAAAAYAIASARLLLRLAGREAAWLSGVRGLAFAALLHVGVELGRWLLPGLARPSGLAATASWVSLGSVLGYLALQRVRPRLESLGAFVAPVAFVLLLVSRFSVGREALHRATWILSAHLTSVAVSLASLTLAFAMSFAYLLLDREMKARRLGGLFRSLPPLEVLDGLSFRAVGVGTFALTLVVLTGHLTSVRLPGAGGLSWPQIGALTAWGLFASIVVLRVAAGWRGRRMALGTIAGYASALIVLMLYVLRRGG